MGKLKDETRNSDPARAARSRLERLRGQQGVPTFSWDEIRTLACSIPEESDEDFSAFLRELRAEGRPQS